MSTMLGGTVSAMAAPVASSAIISGGLCPRRFISGKRAGATVAMSDTFEPEMPETMNSDPSSTYDMPAFTWPISDERKSTIALPMPVASSTQPSSTKIGTDSRTMLDIPSSILDTTTISGAVLAKATKLRVPRPKQKAIGTPAIRHTATKPTRKTRMLRPADCISTGDASQLSSPAAATMTTAPIRTLGFTVRTAYAATMSSMMTMPNNIAATRKLLGISSAGVRMTHSSRTYTKAGFSNATRNASMATSAKPRTYSRGFSGTRLTKSVSRKCSLRCIASAAPIMTTHTKAIEAASSIQTSETWKT